MELIIIITKPVKDQTEAVALANQVRFFAANTPILSDPLVNIEIETKDRIEPG